MTETILGLIIVGGCTGVVLVTMVCLVIITYRINEIATLVDSIDYKMGASNDEAI